MKAARRGKQSGNVLVCALCTILIVSMIGGSVLLNCTARYNVSSNQVRGWKEALQAAEAGGDIAYNEIRKTVHDPSNAFVGWTQAGTTYSNSPVTLGTDPMSTSSVVDIFYYDVFTGNPWYRMRTKGTAPVRGLRRTGMDERMITGARGDSILRKIDFNYDHFIATYGPNGDGVGKTLVPVPQPQVTRRVEQIAGAITPFEAAIKCIGTFYGLGDAALIDSYDSRNGLYHFAANNPLDPVYGDSRSGNVEIDTAVATIRGWVYGDVATNGGSIIRSTVLLAEESSLTSAVAYHRRKYRQHHAAGSWQRRQPHFLFALGSDRKLNDQLCWHSKNLRRDPRHQQCERIHRY
ncbi:MAG: hypothetical protein DME34_03390 [Verrucomicrobia bacterium]|nr:MAG: hypothetical protein DME34_03390 [Verrucomicrobiota bacterium]